jgi:hypothetical protein
MNAEYFEEQRRDMVAGVRAITDHMAAQVGKTALDERVLRAATRVCAGRGPAVRLPEQANSDRFR